MHLYIFDSPLEDCNLSSFMTNTLGFDVYMFVETVAVQEIKPEEKTR